MKRSKHVLQGAKTVTRKSHHIATVVKIEGASERGAYKDEG